MANLTLPTVQSHGSAISATLAALHDATMTGSMTKTKRALALHHAALEQARQAAAVMLQVEADAVAPRAGGVKPPTEP